MRNHFRLLLVEARAAALADGEAAERVIFAIEAIGRFLLERDESMERTSPKLLSWVEEAVPARHDELDKKLQLLRFGRNQRMHKGFAARDLTSDAVRVATILEDALRVNWENFEAADVMTPNPLVVSTWRTFGMVRDAMVENAFSHIPIFWGEKWRAISERQVAAVVQGARKHPAQPDLRNVRLDAEVAKAPEWGTLIEKLLGSSEVPVVGMNEPVNDLSFESGCVLVVHDRGDGAEELVGIITPADVM